MILSLRKWFALSAFLVCFSTGVFADPIPLSTGTAAQSTTNGTFVAARALDGVNNFTHTTSGDNNATWQVLMPTNYGFGEIVVRNRSTCCGSRMRDITVQVVNFTGNVNSDFTGGNVVFSSPLLNPENSLNAPLTITANAGGAIGNMIRIKRTPDPDLSGSNGAGNADESNVLSIDEVTAESLDGISTFAATPQISPPGSPVDLDWVVPVNVTALSIDQGIGDVLALTTNGAGTYTINPGPTVTTTYELSAILANNSMDTATVTVTVELDPIINSLTANQTTIAAGLEATLSWDVLNADTIEINGVLIEGNEMSVPVSPLVTTTYTLVATNGSGSVSQSITITVLNVPDYLPANGRFIEVVKNSTTNTRFHLSEIEAFPLGSIPNEAHTDGTSSNDLVQAGSPATVIPPTTTSIQHGAADRVYDGDIESNGDVWSTNPDLGVEPRYMLDIGSTQPIGIVRIFGRGDSCCTDRLQNFTVNIYADNGSGGVGALVSSQAYPGTAPAGLVAPVELNLAIPDGYDV